MATPRTEVSRSFSIADGRIVTVILRDAIAVEDPYIVLARAKALSVQNGTAVDAEPTNRPIKDCLIKTNISI